VAGPARAAHERLVAAVTGMAASGDPDPALGGPALTALMSSSERMEVDLGGLTLRALATPGHTHEHMAFQLLDGATTLGVFTGGSLIVGSAARTDLVAPERTEALAREQYRSLQRLIRLGDEVEVWPTHGAGSFCSAPPGAERTSRIGIERTTNALLRAESEDAFVKQLLGSLGSFPPYFLELGEINRRGPSLTGSDGLPALLVESVDRLRTGGVEIVDVRPMADFAAQHIPESISIPLRQVFATWLGWLLPMHKPYLVVLNSGQDPEEVLWQARKVGFDDALLGQLDGGIAAWTQAGRAAVSIPLVSGTDLADRHGRGARVSVLDVRQQREFTDGHIPGAVHLELGRLADQPAYSSAGPTIVMCGHGERAMGAASLLARAGVAGISVLAGGPADWARATGQPLEQGA